MLKHIGRHGDRKVAVLFREVPNEGHMCLVIYPDVLPAPWEDAIMRALESDVGQQDKCKSKRQFRRIELI